MSVAPEKAGVGGAAAENVRDAETHRLQRWQQGYDLHEVTREWAALNCCLVDELERCFAGAPETAAAVQAGARATLARFIGDATSDSVAQYFRLARREAAGSLLDLEDALRDLGDMATAPR